jgi:hypothetical protein
VKPGLKDAIFQDASGRRLRLSRVAAERGSARRPVRLLLFVKDRGSESLAGAIELTRREAYAFSEWLDAALTDADEPGADSHPAK